ncbi:MAG: hypothetical protein JSW64_09880 [Candidatus Zixiibacteriota bacterium]|nr:MAG: hypothetical protein JSW64_09880 [candidate division Zixibacteria bacterium]
MRGYVKSCILLCFVFFIATALISAEIIEYNYQQGAQGFALLNQSNSGVKIKYTISKLAIEDIEIEGQILKNVYISGIFLPNNAGAPNLPGDGRMIAIPQSATAQLNILSYQTELIENIDIAPAPPIPKETDNSPPTYERDLSIYNADEYYPASPALLSELSKMRGVDYVILGITPFQYNPVSKQLLVYRELEIEVNFIGGNGHFGEDRLRSRFWEPILRQNLVNYESLPKIDFYSRLLNPSETDDFEYLIIIPDDPNFIAWADSIKNWRTLQGIRTGVVNLTAIGGNNATYIENYVNNAYNTWDIPPVAVLLLSDYQSSGLSYGITSPVWNYYCVSDNIYADVDNNDLPEMAFSRITAQDPTDLSIMINKFLSYERNPPTAANFYYNPITAGGWQTERWFILCTEICWGFMNSMLGKSPVREYAIYSGTPGSVWSTNTNTYMLVDYFGPNGYEYIPATPAHLTDWGANATRINNDINSGAFLLLHRDHGSETGWGEPDYDIGDLSGLDNSNLPLVLSINCLTGRYDYGSEVFAEAFHRMSHGALALIAASEVSYSFVNDTYIFGLFDYMWPGFDPGHGTPGPITLNPSFANASAKYYLQASNWPYNPQHKVYTHHLFHHHGDAFNNIYSAIPQNLTVSHDPVLLAGVSTFTVSANQYAQIGLTADGEIIGAGEGTGLPEPIDIIPQLPGNSMVVTITKPNYFRYSQEISVITTSGPYVIFDSYTINDYSGNNNGLADLGEDIDLGMQLRNVGSDTAFNVVATLSSVDPYVTITDNTENFGLIEDGQGTVYIDNAFSFDVSSSIPDGHSIIFQVDATDDSDSVWTSNFSIVACAPQIEFGGIVIDDSDGNNNGVLDPGESANLIVTLVNSGTGQADGITAVLTESDPYVGIVDDFGTFGEISAGGGTGNNSSDLFLAYAMGTCPSGHSASFNLAVAGDRGYTEDVGFDILIGDKAVIYYDDFSSNQGWTGLGGSAEWTIGPATGGIGNDNYGNPDPSQDHSPTTDNKVLGNDLTPGTGGDYNASISSTYYTTSPVIDCSNFTDVELRFFRWLGVERDMYDNAYFQVYNGSSWITLFENGNSTIDENSWNEQFYNVSSYADGNASFRIRFGLGSTDYAWQYCGWNIDDIELKGYSQGSGNDPEILIVPSAIIDSVRQGEQSLNTLKVYNIGTNNLEVTFTPSAAWIECYGGMNVVAAGDSMDFDVTINAATLTPGDYSETLDFVSNDINHLTGSLPVNVNVRPGGCDYVVGDVNNSGDYNGLDVTYSVSYFKGGPVPPLECECLPGDFWYVAGDVNNSCSFNGLDVTYSVSYFKGGPDPVPCQDCPPSSVLGVSGSGNNPIFKIGKDAEQPGSKKKNNLK